MCTLSVIARDGGYRLGMNRDERIARGPGLPLEMYERRGTRSVYPSDGMGGTWIGANEFGISLALLNWNDVAAPLVTPARSRGQVIPALIASRSLAELEQSLGRLKLSGIHPFRLSGVFFSEQRICEWCWDGVRLDGAAFGWHRHHRFSSSLGDGRAASERGLAFAEAQAEAEAGSIPWLRRLHAGHRNGPAAFSVCVHRPDVETLSYTEVECAPGQLRMTHFPGSPCAPACCQQIQLRRGDSRLSEPAWPPRPMAWSA